MNKDEIIETIKGYHADFQKYLSRFRKSDSGLHINQEDDPKYRQEILEISDFLNDCLGSNSYSRQIIEYYHWGLQNWLQSPSYKSLENITGVLGAVITRLSRNPELLDRKHAQENIQHRQNIFIIHGRDEAKWRELKDIIREEFRLNPIVLQEQPDAGCKTVIEKFEHYANQCSYAVAVFTPDDEISEGENFYLQARPNVIYELGWFCGRSGRGSAMLLLKEGTSIFSDFGGIIQKRFDQNIKEKITEIKRDLIACGILDDL